MHLTSFYDDGVETPTNLLFTWTKIHSCLINEGLCDDILMYLNINGNVCEFIFDVCSGGFSKQQKYKFVRIAWSVWCTRNAKL